MTKNRKIVFIEKVSIKQYKNKNVGEKNDFS